MITLDISDNCATAFGGELFEPLAIALPRGVVRQGAVQNPELMAEALIKALPAAKGRDKAVCFELQSQLGQYRELTLPALPAGKLEAAIRLQYQGSISNLRDYVLDYYEVAREDKERVYQSVLLPRAIVEQYLSLAKAIGRPCHGVELRLDVLRRRAQQYGVADGAFILIQLLENEAEILLVEGRRVFVRPVQFQSDAAQLAEWGIAVTGAQETAAQRAALLAQQTDRLVQFQLSRNSALPVSAIYAAGFAPNEALLSECGRILGRDITQLPLYLPKAAQNAQAEQAVESGAAL